MAKTFCLFSVILKYNQLIRNEIFTLRLLRPRNCINLSASWSVVTEISYTRQHCTKITDKEVLQKEFQFHSSQQALFLKLKNGRPSRQGSFTSASVTHCTTHSIHCMQVVKHASRGSILALKPRAFVTRNPKQRYQLSHNWCPLFFFKQNNRQHYPSILLF